MTKLFQNRKRMALALSVLLLLLWFLLGTHSTVAWFSDQKEQVNTFRYGNVKLKVDYLQDPGLEIWANLDGATDIFNDQALYEPGYTQVARIRITNQSDIPVEYRVAVTGNDRTLATNVLGGQFYLSEYLKYGIIFAPSNEALTQKLTDRTAARDGAGREVKELFALPTADMISLNHYFYPEEQRVLGVEDSDRTVYAALVVYMPWEVGNEANYRGDIVPRVGLGIHVLASQTSTIEKIP